MNKVIVFDLDDTIYKEINFLKSGYKYIIEELKYKYNISLNYNQLISDYHKGLNVFEKIISRNRDKNIKITFLLDLYRYHIPNIYLNEIEYNFFKKLYKIGYKLGIITDGRTATQTNKIKALKIFDFFSDIIISEDFGYEKPSINNYKYFENKYSGSKFYYIGDNTQKDFVTPNKLDWITIGIRDIDNKNIHKQNLKLQQGFLPKYWVNNLPESYNYILNT